MAVVQISRIQHRRGRKLEGTGLPQLASGEIGWAIDTQELYIGNGAVSEGAPAVGNTKVLTEKDDLLLLAAQYAYQREDIQTSANTASPIERTIEDRLNERVSIFSFLPESKRPDLNGSASDVTEEVQRALDELYLKDVRKGNLESRVALYFPPGEYLVSSSLKVPPFATLIGAGKGKTKITGVDSGIFTTVNEDSEPGSYQGDATASNENQPRHILISGMTLYSESNGGVVLLQSCRNSVFEDLELLGNWESSFSVSTDYPAFKMTAASSLVTCDQNEFRNIDIKNFVSGFYSDFDIKYNIFDNCAVTNAHRGFSFGVSTVIGAVGQATGPLHNTIKNSRFDNIMQEGINITNGTYNLSESNRFTGVGNNGGNAASATYPILEFASLTNISRNDFFERIEQLTIDSTYLTGNHVPTVRGQRNFEYAYPISTTIGVKQEEEAFISLPADGDQGAFKIDYWYSASTGGGDVIRKGCMDIIYNKGQSQCLFNHDYIINGEDPLDGNAVVFDAGFTDPDNAASSDITVTIQNLYPVVNSDRFTFMITQHR
jgi:hypothetical protein